MSEIVIVTKLGQKKDRFYIVKSSSDDGVLMVGDINIQGDLVGIADTFSEAKTIATKIGAAIQL